MKNQIVRSIQNEQRLEMIYPAADGQFTQRVIKPIKLSNNLLLAYCYRKRQVRTFKLDNILSVQSVSRRVGA